MKMMSLLAVVVGLLVPPAYAEEYKMLIINAPDVFNSFNVAQNQCNQDSFSAQQNTVVQILSKVGDKSVVKVIRAYIGDGNMVEINETYCISNTALSEFFIDFTKTDYGILAIPYKVRFSPFKLFPGGTLGGYVGRKFVRQNSTSSLLGFGGLATIPINTLTTPDNQTDVPDIKLGISVGVGYVWYLAEGFQIGGIVGYDFFDGFDKWTYRKQPWLSFNIGYGFTSGSRERSEQLQQLRLAR